MEASDRGLSVILAGFLDNQLPPFDSKESSRSEAAQELSRQLNICLSSVEVLAFSFIAASFLACCSWSGDTRQFSCGLHFARHPLSWILHFWSWERAIAIRGVFEHAAQWSDSYLCVSTRRQYHDESEMQRFMGLFRAGDGANKAFRSCVSRGRESLFLSPWLMLVHLRVEK